MLVADINFVQDFYPYWLHIVRNCVCVCATVINYFFLSSSVSYVFFKPVSSFKTFQQRRDILTINQKTDWLRTDSAAASCFYVLRCTAADLVHSLA